MWQRVKMWLRIAWPWLVAVVAALLTAGAVRRFGAARDNAAQLREAARIDDERARLAKLAASQRRAQAQRDAILQLADEVERKAREAEKLDASLVFELQSLRERVAGMSEPELLAEAQAAARRYRNRVTGGIILIALMLSAAPVRADDICIARADLETLVVATNEATARIDLLRDVASKWAHDAALLRIAVSTSRTAEDAASERADVALAALARAEAAEAKTRSSTRLRVALTSTGAALVAVLATVAITVAVRP